MLFLFKFSLLILNLHLLNQSQTILLKTLFIHFYKKYITYLTKCLPLIFTELFKDELSISISYNNLRSICYFLKKHIQTRCVSLVSITTVDIKKLTLKTKNKFCIIYNVLSYDFNIRLKIKTYVNETTYVQSIIKIFPNANWLERENYDMFGILFNGNKDNRRILTDYNFNGYPLLKEFPLIGEQEKYFIDYLNNVYSLPINFKGSNI